MRFHPHDNRILRVPQSRSNLRVFGCEAAWSIGASPNLSQPARSMTVSNLHKFRSTSKGLELVSNPPGVAARRQDGDPGNPLVRMAEATSERVQEIRRRPPWSGG
jgi:hypothetical protein